MHKSKSNNRNPKPTYIAAGIHIQYTRIYSEQIEMHGKQLRERERELIHIL
jgi:hypothetical protein